MKIYLINANKITQAEAVRYTSFSVIFSDLIAELHEVANTNQRGCRGQIAAKSLVNISNAHQQSY